jgi:hypothetical protein
MSFRQTGNLDVNRMAAMNARRMKLEPMTHKYYEVEMNKLRPFLSAQTDNEALMIKLNEKWNCCLDRDVLDLHYLPLELAKKVYNKRVQEITNRKRKNVIYVCHGWRNGSAIKDWIRSITGSEQIGANEGLTKLTFPTQR